MTILEQLANMALNDGARLIGVNNRNRKDFSVDTENSCRLRKLIPNCEVNDDKD